MKKLPLIIGNELFIRSLERRTLKTKSRLIGARHGDFILIEKPTVAISERLSSPLEGEVLCSLFHEGNMYTFESRIKKSFDEGITLLTYPAHVQVEKIRKHHRIQVNIETRLHLEGSAQVNARIHDISEGGCCLQIPAVLNVNQHTNGTMEFTLPDNQRIDGLIAKVCNVHLLRVKKITTLGVQFLGPPAELAKIASFCQYCMFFKA